MRAIRITKENIDCITMINNGIALDKEHCLAEPHFFIDPEYVDGYYDLMHEKEFKEAYNWARGEKEIENVFVQVHQSD